MKLATLRTPAGTVAVRVDGPVAVEIGPADVGALLADPSWRDLALAADGRRHELAGADYAPVVPHPGKFFCVGLNYRTHILETGREPPRYPTLFAKYPDALVGAHDEVVLPAASAELDWEAELGVVVGAEVRHADLDQARAAIAGYTVVNDVTARDWQYRTLQWLQGKTFESTCPFGPVLVTQDHQDLDPDGFELTCQVNGQEVQRALTSDLVFGPAELVSYISTMVTLRPGDVIATGTPGGVGRARKPPRYLADGDALVTRISGVGECHNICRAEKQGG